MVVRAQGSYPGADLAAAVNVILGECEPSLFFPSLPERGPAATPVARISALFEELHWGAGLRALEMHSRVTRFSHQVKDLWERDWDTFLNVLDENHAGEGALHFVIPGPYSIAANVELPNGHWALTDPGAVRHLVEELAGAVEQLTERCGQDTARTPIIVLDEMAAGAALAGRQPGAHKFEEIPRPAAETVVAQWQCLSRAAQSRGTTENCTVLRFPADHCDWLDYVPQWDDLYEQARSHRDEAALPLRIALNLTAFPSWDAQHIDSLGERLESWGKSLELSAITGGPVAQANYRAHILAQQLRQLGVSPQLKELPVLHSVWGVGTACPQGAPGEKTVEDARHHMQELRNYPQLVITEWERRPS